MSFGVNVVVLQGRLVKDPQFKHIDTSNGGFDVAEFTLAVSHYTKDKNNQKTSFIPCSAFGHSAKFLSSYAGQGDEILVRGEMEQQSWTDKEGQKRSKILVKCESVNITRKKKEQANNGEYPPNTHTSPPMDNPVGSKYPDSYDDDMPDF